MQRPDPARRGFLRGLVSLPLIGGGLTLIGSPTAAAEPFTRALLDSYDAWLFYERRILQRERGLSVRSKGVGVADLRGEDIRIDGERYDFVPMANAGGAYHWDRERHSPTERAAIVLSAVGCDWRRP